MSQGAIEILFKAVPAKVLSRGNFPAKLKFKLIFFFFKVSPESNGVNGADESNVLDVEEDEKEKEEELRQSVEEGEGDYQGGGGDFMLEVTLIKLAGRRRSAEDASPPPQDHLDYENLDHGRRRNNNDDLDPLSSLVSGGGNNDYYEEVRFANGVAKKSSKKKSRKYTKEAPIDDRQGKDNQNKATQP